VLKIHGVDGRQILAKPLDKLKEEWQKPIRW